MPPVFEVFLIVDVGLDGAAFVARVGANGPEALCRPFRWFHHRRSTYDRQKADLHDRLRLFVQEYRPRVLAIEQPVSIIGRKRVGVSQAWLAAEICMVVGGCPRPPEVTIQVPGQHGEGPVTAWAVMRSSFAEILSPEEMRELNGPKGEHVRDGCAILLAAIPRYEEMRRKVRAAR